MTINASLLSVYGPPAFYEPQFLMPSASLHDIQLATSLAGHSFLQNWLNQAEKFEDKDEWVNFLFLLSIATHFDPAWAWDALFPLFPRAYQNFCNAGLAGKTPIALYWPIILAPIFYHHPKENGIVDLGQAIFKAGDSTSRTGIVQLLCLSRDETTAKHATEILQVAVKDQNERVRAEAILSLIKCGPIPGTIQDALEGNLENPRTYLPAASALFHMTGKEEFFTILQDAAEDRKMEVAMQAADALEPLPTRQCIVKSCQNPIQFKEYWREWRKHVTPINFWDAYQLWRSPAVKFFCCNCFNQVTNLNRASDCCNSE